MSWATQGQIRLLERRLMRLADQSEKVLAWIEQRRELLEQMERLDLGHGVPSPAASRVRTRKRGASADPERLEELQRQAKELRLKTADWVDRVRQAVLDGARLEPRLLPLAESTRGLRLWWERGPEQMHLVVLRARAALEEGIALMQPPVEGTPPPVVAPVSEKSEKRLLSVKEAAAMLTISTKKLYRMAALMQIRHVSLGRSLRLPSSYIRLTTYLGQTANTKHLLDKLFAS
jgi:excisionase family DNA binding protein